MKDIQRFVVTLSLVGLVGCTSTAQETHDRVAIAEPGSIESCLGSEVTVLPQPGPQSADQLPEIMRREPPVFPPMALEARVDGTVVMDALICADGSVYDTRVTTSIPMLDRAAVDAVRGSSFRPASRRGKAVPAWFEVAVEFKLPDLPPRSKDARPD